MSAFNVVVRIHDAVLSYSAIGPSSCAVHMSAVERFGVCGVTVVPKPHGGHK